MALTGTGEAILWEQSFARREKLPNDWTDIIAVGIGAEPIAVRRDGSVLTRGGVMGIEAAPSGLRDVSSVAVSHITPYALRNDGTVVTWGKSNPLTH